MSGELHSISQKDIRERVNYRVSTGQMTFPCHERSGTLLSLAQGYRFPCVEQSGALIRVPRP